MNGADQQSALLTAALDKIVELTIQRDELIAIAEDLTFYRVGSNLNIKACDRLLEIKEEIKNG